MELTPKVPDWVSRCRIAPFAHQIIGVETMRQRSYFLLADEMGAGKSKQAIDLAQVLHVYDHKIRRVIVVTDASIRPVWFDPEFGELAKHLWKGLPSRVIEYHAKMNVWNWETTAPPREPQMEWLVTNYDYIIDAEYDSKKRLIGGRLKELVDWAGPDTLLILDESSAVKNHKAVRTKACEAIRKRCGYVLLLNGTPIANSPLDMFSQGNIMNPGILDCRGVTQFRARYAIMGGYMAEIQRGGRTFKIATQVLRWTNIEDLQRRFAPFILRRLKKDCMDLPEQLPPVTLTATMSKTDWATYKSMRDDMVAWIGSGVASTQQVIAKVMRLAQITSGFLGGIEEFQDIIDARGSEESHPDWIPTLPLEFELKAPAKVQEIGTAKLDLFLSWLDDRLIEEPTMKLIVWCRFRPELERLVRVLREKYGKGLLLPSGVKYDLRVEAMHGGQKPEERERALRLLDPRTTTEGPGIVAATVGTGGKGHTFTAAHTVVNMSYDYSLEKYLQARDRVHRFGQTHPVSNFDIACVGPAGQKTIDHLIIRARTSKENLADMTTSAWVNALTEE